jgi:hypothetical protein
MKPGYMQATADRSMRRLRDFHVGSLRSGYIMSFHDRASTSTSSAPPLNKSLDRGRSATNLNGSVNDRSFNGRSASKNNKSFNNKSMASSFASGRSLAAPSVLSLPAVDANAKALPNAASSISEAPAATLSFVPSILLACPCELVHLEPIPDSVIDECDNPDGVREFLSHKPWLHDTMEGYFKTVKRFMRVTKRGTVLFSLPRKDHPYAVDKKKGTARVVKLDEIDFEERHKSTDAPLMDNAATLEDDDEEEDPDGDSRSSDATPGEEEEEITGTMRLQDISALLPVYDLDSGHPYEGMVMMARYVRPPKPKSKIMGDGTEGVISIAMAPEHLLKLADLVLSFGAQSSSRLATAYKDARPFANALALGSLRQNQKSTKQAAVNEPAAAEPDNVEQVASSSSEDEDDEDAELRAALFGADYAKKKKKKSTADDDEFDTDDDEFRAALGLSPKRRLGSSGAAGMARDADANADGVKPPQTIIIQGHEFPLTSENSLLNPFRMGIGLLPPRLQYPPNSTAPNTSLRHHPPIIFTCHHPIIFPPWGRDQTLGEFKWARSQHQRR